MCKEAVSVVIPVYNGQRYLAQAIRSVVAQSHQPLEIVVVDDGSTDSTADVAKKFPEVRYFYQENAGQAAARNRGVKEAKGALLAFLDADDLWPVRKLAGQVEALRVNPSLDVVFGHARQFVEPTSEAGGIQSATYMQEPQRAQLPGAMLIRRAAFEQVGGYATEWRVGEVVDWYARAIECGLLMEMLPQVVLLRRIHGENLTVCESNSPAEYLAIVAAALHRRRSCPNGQATRPRPCQRNSV